MSTASAVGKQTVSHTSWLTLARRHPLIAFFLLAFGLSWAILVPMTLASYGLVPFPTGSDALPLLVLMGYGPTIAAVLVGGAVGGRAEIGALLKRLLIWRVGWRWWAITLFLNAAVVLGALGVYGLLGNPMPTLPSLGPALLLEVGVTFLISGLINGEEIGWRGFATPRLLERYGTIGTLAVLGVLETIFHLPIFFNNGSSAAGGQNGTPFLAFFAGVVLLVFLFTWLYQHTRGSLLLATAFHASANTWTTILPIPSTSLTFSWLMVAAQLVVVGVVLATCGTGWLTRRPEASAPVESAAAPGRERTRPAREPSEPREGIPTWG
jgi:membrane protease YdiL (CAAX protease family)